MRTAAALFVSLALTACTSVAPPPSCLAGRPAVETQLYFGLSMKDRVVNARDWQRFVEREVTPRFPQGYSVADVRGAWLSDEAKRTISENSKLLIRIHGGTATDNDAIAAIITAYKSQFAQESVMRVDQNICVAF